MPSCQTSPQATGSWNSGRGPGSASGIARRYFYTIRTRTAPEGNDDGGGGGGSGGGSGGEQGEKKP